MLRFRSSLSKVSLLCLVLAGAVPMVGCGGASQTAPSADQSVEKEPPPAPPHEGQDKGGPRG